MDRKKIALKAIAATVAVVMILAIVPSEASAYTYNRQNAVNYALSNWNSNVPGSWYFNLLGGDCANFASNCLKAGGWPEVYEPSAYSLHCIYKSNPRAWYANSWRSWYSYTWGGANNFGRFVSIYSGRGYARSISSDSSQWHKYFKKGDIIQTDDNRDGKWDHTMIVTGVSSRDLFMTYHTGNTINRRLTEIRAEKPNARFIGYCLYDSFSR